MGMYKDWVAEYGRRMLSQFESIKTQFNFDYGPEFEIAVASILKEVLPQRYGVCRGAVITETGCRGDDIIIFDVGRFPTLRSLGRDLSKKDYVPIEGVLAYIEAKHTLYVTEDKPAPANPATCGQSLEKACSQVAAVKGMKRERFVPLIGPEIGPGLPKYKNPLLGAIFARNIVVQWEYPERFLAGELLRLKGLAWPLPDLIAAGGIVVIPVYIEGVEEGSAKPFHCKETQLMALRTSEEVVFGVGIVQLLRAIEWIDLGSIPWHRVVADAISENGQTVPAGWGKPPIMGPD